MKTARELLLKRHRSIEPKLDALRAKTVSALRESARCLVWIPGL